MRHASNGEAVMTDILERLREQAEYYSDGHGPLHEDAAHEIERLRHERRNLQRSWAAERAEVNRLRNAIDNIIMAADLPGDHCEMEDAIAFARAALEGANVDDKT
jgi:hypothetical protein